MTGVQKSIVRIELTLSLHPLRAMESEARVSLQVAFVCLLQISETPIISDATLHLTTVDCLFPRSHVELLSFYK